jgi:hypothetical protein
MWKVRSEAALVHTMNAYMGCTGIAPVILTIALDGRQWSTSRTGPSTTGKESWYPMNGKMAGPENRSERIERRKVFDPNEIRPQIFQPVAQSLYRLSYPGCFTPVRFIISVLDHLLLGWWNDGWCWQGMQQRLGLWVLQMKAWSRSR